MKKNDTSGIFKTMKLKYDQYLNVVIPNVQKQILRTFASFCQGIGPLKKPFKSAMPRGGVAWKTDL